MYVFVHFMYSCIFFNPLTAVSAYLGKPEGPSQMVNGLNYEQVIERLFDDGFKL